MLCCSIGYRHQMSLEVDVDVVVCFLLVSLGRNRNSSWELEIDDVAVAMVMFCATPIRRTGTNAATSKNTPNSKPNHRCT